MPSLIEALERRDVDMRAQAHLILQQILGRAVPFDPYAPETMRRQQIMGLREQFTREGGIICCHAKFSPSCLLCLPIVCQ